MLNIINNYPELIKIKNNVHIDLSDDNILSSFKKLPTVALVGIIVGQKISYLQAKEYRRKIYEELGDNFKLIDVINSNIFKNLPVNNQNIILNVYDKIGNDVNIDNIKNIKIKGIGEWSISSTLLVIDPTLDIFPCGDKFLQERIRRLYKLNKVPTIKEMNEITQKYSPNRGIVAWYLWRWF